MIDTSIDSLARFRESIKQGIPNTLPAPHIYDTNVNHAPKRKKILSQEEEELALRNALRYFEPRHHTVLLPEFKKELEQYGRIYMYRFMPDYEIKADFPLHFQFKIFELLHGHKIFPALCVLHHPIDNFPTIAHTFSIIIPPTLKGFSIEQKLPTLFFLNFSQLVKLGRCKHRQENSHNKEAVFYFW